MNFTVGTAVNVTPKAKIAFDVKQIYYNKVKTIGNKPPKGFGWKDMTVFMAGAKYDYGYYTLGLGYNYGKSPIPNDQVFANALFPAVAEHHFNVGGTVKLGGGYELLGSAYYSPEKKQTDPGTGGQFSQVGKGTKIKMSQYGLKIGIKGNF